MANLRFLLYLSIAFVLFLLWERWQLAQEPPPAAMADASPPQAAGDAPRTVDPDKAGDLPGSVAAERVEPVAQGLRDDLAGAGGSAGRVRVVTDVFDADIGLLGGDLRRVDLSRVPRALDRPEPVRLLDDGAELYVMQSGLLHDRLPDRGDTAGYAPTHHAVYAAEADTFRLADGEDVLRVPLLWRGPDGVTVEKVFVFRRGSYLVGLEHIVRNHSERAWVGRQYRQLRRRPPTDDGNSAFIYTFTGAAYYDGTYNKLEFDEIAAPPLRQTVTGGWVAMLQHYFVAALVPDTEDLEYFYTRAVGGDGGNEAIIGMRSPSQTAPPGAETRFATQLYAGPKYQRVLEEVAPKLDLTTDYGILTVLSQPLFWLLEEIHGFLGNWGWSIVALTTLIKLLFYKLSETSYRSMARMKKFQPQFKTLRERYKDDRERQQKEMMELYRREKINPLAGCLPILVQIPVFIALYWMLLETVELRQAPFVLWIQDLSTRDPYFVLPLLMGATMLVQTHLNPKPPDPLQAKVMAMLPIIFTVFFAFFPSGLVLYWLVNNLLSIAQQWFITRRIEQAA